MRPTLVTLALPLLAAASLGVLQDPKRSTWIEPGYHHLGNDPTPEWPEAPEEPSSAPLEIVFSAEPNPSEWTLRWRQRHVDGAWRLSLNDTLLGELPQTQDLLTQHLAVPAGVLRRGSNLLRVEGGDPNDDFTFGEVALLHLPFHRALGLGRLQVEILDAAGGLIPARLTLLQAPGPPPRLFPDSGSPAIPLRPGVAYAADGRASFWLPAGRTAVFASRGLEWSCATQEAEIRLGEATSLVLRLDRQFPTEGLVAVDTHIHTVTFSGHGDASLDERLHTLAGEGVELAIATDHNHQVDYRPRQAELGLSRWFTSVVGNEVTTDNGHFNAFPLPAAGPRPNHQLGDWEDLVAGMRSLGAKVVILNHPRWPVGDSPFDLAGLDAASGQARAPLKLSMDAIELFNSTTPEVHPDRLIEDWFGLLNAGFLLTAAGSSDSHTVADPVGQGRTYLRSTARSPSEIDVEEACGSLLDGRSSISLGLFAELLVDGEQAMGRRYSPPPDGFSFQLRVAAPHWARAETVSVYVNGAMVEERAVPALPPGPTDVLLDFQLPKLAEDAWLVCVVRGPKIEEPFWNSRMPYSAALTNPVWLDDGDGEWKSLKRVAGERLSAAGADPAMILRVLQGASAPFLAQAGVLLRERLPATFEELRLSPGPHQAVFERISSLHPPISK